MLVSEYRVLAADLRRFKQSHATRPAINAPAIKHPIATPATAPPESSLLFGWIFGELVELGEIVDDIAKTVGLDVTAPEVGLP